jgi:hypothetical protein
MPDVYFSSIPLKLTGEPVKVGFWVEDPIVPQSIMEVTVTSSNPALVPNAKLSVASGEFGPFGGSHHFNRELTITPIPGVTGTATITVTVYRRSNRIQRQFEVLVSQ